MNTTTQRVAFLALVPTTLISIASGRQAIAASHSPIIPGTLKLECSMETGEGSYLAAGGGSTRSKIKVHVTNGDDIDVALRFDLLLTATNGARAHYNRQGKTFINRHSDADFEFLPFQDQQSVNGPSVYAKTCKLTNIAACPSYPPANWPKNTEYSPFLAGNAICTHLRNVGPIVFKTPTSGGITAEQPSGIVNVLLGCVHLAGYDNNTSLSSFRNTCTQAVSVLFYRYTNSGIAYDQQQADMGASQTIQLNLPHPALETIFYETCPLGYHLVDKSTGAKLSGGSQTEGCAK